MTLIYHIFSILIVIVIVPLFTVISLFTKYKFKFILNHFGFVPSTTKNKRKTLWLYALSLGEVKAAKQVLKKIKHKDPSLRIVVSVTTDSGYEGALEHLKMAENIFFQPLDCMPFTWLGIRKIQPDLYVINDTGFWPGLIDQLHKKKIPVILFNGRISHRSVKTYLKAGSLFKNLFQQFDRLCMQNKNSLQAALSLGVNPEKLEVLGDPKFDTLQTLTEQEKKQLQQAFKLKTDSPIWIAGSTHAGEETIILDAHQQLKKKHPHLILILAPRRTERAGDIDKLLQKKNISFCRRSLLKNNEPNGVILLDTMGELAKLYSLGQVAFVGRSLVEPGGGHSLIEPLSHGVVVLHGPHIENIDAVANEANKRGLAFTVYNAEDIQEKVHALLENSNYRIELVAKAKSFINDQKGAAEKMATITLDILKS
ncbi:MAG: 3-deoxy-D-manno-octulosonic acid transferase [Nitrospinota bacterium]|nr:3-deoxy-D-manno-octulosonic acid transferase [Nitrospinota bacterium]